ncbi:MAG: leucyl aminopeptidase [Parcubacteria group bacterium Gr01-1014_38]|nr:MAG: leucyl aminopeptidase [Parcubacteria group bacterium Gr01-1014_38]
MSVPLSVRPVRRGLPAAEVITVFSDGKTFSLPEAAARPVRSRASNGARVAREHLQRAAFKGEAHETHALPLPGRTARTLFIVGTGKALTLDVIRRGVAAAVQHAKAEGLRTVSIIAPFAAVFGSELGRAFAEGALLANYRFTAYSAETAKREKRLALQRVELLVPPQERKAVEEGVQRGTIDASATMLARDLVNEPASRMTPQSLVEEAQKIAKASRGAIELTILDRAQCAERGMGAFLAVAQGSTAEPAFLHVVYRPAPKLPIVALVGKGITFDSGGLSLKPADGMETMKIDMAGAASVLGVFSALPKLKFPIEVHGFIAACENMPSGSAVKPGDIVRTASGKTVEILNTDAEGRLTLADAIAEARKVRPQVILDLATLTGACVVALGEEVTGLFSNDEATAGKVLRAAESAGEYVWRLPLIPEYRSNLKSSVADMKNITGKRWGGAITAALFLKEFIGNTPWAHLDIAGPSYAEKQTHPAIPVGGTGVGVRTVLRYLESLPTR